MTINHSRFVLCSDDPILADHLSDVLSAQAQLQTISLQDALSPQVWERQQPHLVFFDFILESNLPNKFAELGQIIKGLNQTQPNTPQIALGSGEHAISAIQALRAGVNEFIDPGQEHEILEATRRLLQRHPAVTANAVPSQQAKTLLILGARPGVGASTFSAHLSAYLQDCLNQSNAVTATSDTEIKQRVCLMDLGWPLADSLIYLNTTAQFRFNDALLNLHRLDATLLNTALTQTKNGLSLLPLPMDLKTLDPFTTQHTKQLFSHFCRYFSHLIIDMSGFENKEIVANFIESSDEIWLITDQSVASLVSLAEQIKTLEKKEISQDNIKLIVNKYNESYGLTDSQIANQFGLTLLATLPDQTKSLLQSSSQGLLLTHTHKKNPYSKKIKSMVKHSFNLEIKKPKTKFSFKKIVK